MEFKTDIQIAQECVMAPITEIAEKAGIEDKYLEQYGKYKAKIDYNLLQHFYFIVYLIKIVIHIIIKR